MEEILSNTMLCGYILITIILGQNVHGAYVQSINGITYFTDRLADVIKTKCLVNADEATSNTALDGLYHFTQCWQIGVPNYLAGSELYNNCMRQGKHFHEDLEMFMEKLTPCIEPEEEYLKQLILDSYGEFNHYFCKSFSATGENQIKADRCKEMFAQDPSIHPSVVCFKNSKAFGDIKTKALTKSIFCSDISDIHSCYEDLLNKYCPDSSEVRDLQLILFKQVLENCVKHANK